MSSIPVIVASGLTGKKFVYTAIQMGAKDYIIKPFAAATLVQKIRRALRDQDFVEYAVPADSPLPLTLSVGSEISRVSDTGFFLESPIKLSGNVKISIEAEIFDKLEMKDIIFVTSEKPGSRAISGNYISRVNAVGISKSISRKLKERP